MHARARTFTMLGVEAHPVDVEVDIRQGLGAFSLVGLPDAAVRESRERVHAAIGNSGFNFPNQRLTASLAPANLPKAGAAFDLAIAAAVLVADGKVPATRLDGCALAGELGLDGAIKPVPGVLAMAERARGLGLPVIAVPAANAEEAALGAGFARNGASAVHPPRVVPLQRLEQVCSLGTEAEPAASAAPGLDSGHAGGALPDLSDLRGQPSLCYALEVAAAGGHGLLIAGPPGAGKSLAARRLPSILPPLTEPEMIDVLRIASATGRVGAWERIGVRPFRAPHHTVSAAGLVGGGSPPRPGEVTLAHRGVLFLDELPEFSRDALEALRQPMEDGRVRITRARHSIELPSRFMLVAAANPCPCGHGPESPDCRCTAGAVRRYAARLSGALADRVDIALDVEQPQPEALSGSPGESSATVRERVIAARERQERRLGVGRSNAEMAPRELRELVRPDREAVELLIEGHRRLRLSGRGHDRVLRVSRTLADLDGAERVGAGHVASALSLRRRGAE